MHPLPFLVESNGSGLGLGTGVQRGYEVENEVADAAAASHRPYVLGQVVPRQLGWRGIGGTQH